MVNGPMAEIPDAELNDFSDHPDHPDNQEPQSFEERQKALAELLKDDELHRMAIAGIYIFMQDFDAQMRGTFQIMQGMGGPRSMLKMIFGKGGSDNE